MEIIFCVNHFCPMKTKCGRHEINNEKQVYIMWSSFAYFEPDAANECKYFYSLDDDDNEFQKQKNISC